MNNTFLQRVLATDNGAAALALRVCVGIIFIADRKSTRLNSSHG